jgi:hypothetical protein
MATERQIAANRLNAGKSTGPRSRAAKQRSSRNAFRHGLSLSLTSSAAIAKRLDVLARKIAGNSKNEIILEHARAAAQAELDLARVRQVKVGLIERVSALGSLDTPHVFGSAAQGIRYLRSILSGRSPPAMPQRIDPLTTMPTEEPQRTAEAVRRALPELLKLDRYESRAVGRRDRAIRQIVKNRSGGERDQGK